MRDQHVVGVPAVRKNAEAAHRAAKIFLAPLAGIAGPAPDPWMCEHPVTDLDSLGLRTKRDNFADILVAESDGQLHAPVGKTQALAPAEIEIPFRQVDIAMADAGRQDFQQDFAAGRLRRWLFVELKGLAANTDLEHTHRTLSRVFSRSQEAANHSPQPASLAGKSLDAFQLQVDRRSIPDRLINDAVALGKLEEVVKLFLRRIGIEIEAQPDLGKADWRIFGDAERAAKVEIPFGRDFS